MPAAEPVGAGDLAVIADLVRCGPMLSPHVPRYLPLVGRAPFQAPARSASTDALFQ